MQSDQRDDERQHHERQRHCPPRRPATRRITTVRCPSTTITSIAIRTVPSADVLQCRHDAHPPGLRALHRARGDSDGDGMSAHGHRQRAEECAVASTESSVRLVIDGRTEKSVAGTPERTNRLIALPVSGERSVT